MDIRLIRTLRGPNIWSRRPVLEAWVDLGALKDTSSDSVPGFTDRLMAWLPSLIEHRCSIGERGGFLQRLRTGTYPAHILEHLTLELQSLAGTPVGFGKARATSEEGVYRVVVRYRDEQVARAALLTARELVLAAMGDKPFDVQAEVAKLRDLVERVLPEPSTPAPVEEEARAIPITCVTGTNGKTTVTRLLAHLLRTAGRRVGMCCSDGIWVGDGLIEHGDCDGPDSARKVLQHPEVEAAVLEAGRGGILREGLGFDKCDVAVVTNLGEADHLGSESVETPEDMFTVKRCPVDVVLPTGAAVLKADDPLVADMARLSDGAVLFFALEAEHPVLAAHREQGKRAAYVRDGWLTLAEGTSETRLAPVAELPMAAGGRALFQVENALAAAAAGWALGLDAETLRTGLATFRGDATDAPGRFNVFEHRGATLVVDDCHNTSALAALVGALGRFPEKHRTVVYSAGPARRDADIVQQAEQLARAFDRVIVYEDGSAHERARGELTALFRRGLSAGGRVSEVLEILEHRQAVETAMRLARAGELVVIQTEDGATGPTVELVQSLIRASEVQSRAS